MTRWAALRIAILVLFATAAIDRIVATHAIFNPTTDEPIHVAAGYDWLLGKPYTFDIEHPPLARIFFALPLRLAGVPEPRAREGNDRGNELLFYFGGGERYLRTAGWARDGNLVFFVLLLAGVWGWGRYELGERAAFWATLLVIALPPVLAHAGLATVDLSGAAALPWALFALAAWLDSPTRKRALLFGIAVGLGLLTKFSFLLFFPCCAVFVIAGRLRLLVTRHMWGGWAAGLIALLIVGGGYRFDVGTMADAHPRGKEIVSIAFDELIPIRQWIGNHVPLPAPLFLDGILEVQLHNRRGHVTCFRGVYSRFGTWSYFPITLWFKTPIAFLALAAAGAALLMPRKPELGLAWLGVLLPAMASTINIGIRHILPIYPLLAIPAGYAVASMWRWRAGQIAAAVLVAWQLADAVRAYPDYLAWFNESMPAHPERMYSDSNISWEQDLMRLVAFCRQHRVQRLGIALGYSTDLHKIGLPPTYDYSARHEAGWVAVDVATRCRLLPQQQAAFAALDRDFVATVGKSIWMYYVPDVPNVPNQAGR